MIYFITNCAYIASCEGLYIKDPNDVTVICITVTYSFQLMQYVDYLNSSKKCFAILPPDRCDLYNSVSFEKHTKVVTQFHIFC